MKKKTENTELHIIKNEKRPRVIKKRGGKTAFKAKFHRRRTQVIAMFSSLAILAVGILAIGSIFNKAEPNIVEPGFSTVSFTVPNDGSLPTDHSALENIGYMNNRFQGQRAWYSEMHGSTVANTMGINVNQSVNTYKQYQNETLIMADITTSSMVNKARQFCYQGNEVLWRLGAGSSSAWPTGKMGEDRFSALADMKWNEGAPYGHMSLDAFTAKNGLPGTGFSVYVINEETLLSADAVIDHGDGTYSQTYYLNPAVDKAPCHYVNQMVFTGDLPSLPSFNYITVTYTFDNTWQILKSQIDEQYTAVMGVSATCTSAYETNFEYNTYKSESTAFHDYFKTYVGEPFTEPDQKPEVSPLNCLTAAFASVLTEPVTFDLDLNVNGTATNGKVYVDVGQMTLETMDIRAQIGSLKLWLANGNAFVEYGGVKVKTSLSEFLGLIEEITGGSGGGLSLDTDALLGALADGDFTSDEHGAVLASTLSLGIDIPVTFRFDIDADGNISLGNVIANITFDNLKISSLDLGDLQIGAALRFGEGGLNALSDAEAALFADIVPLARDVISVLGSDVLNVNVNYEGDGFSLAGEFDIAVAKLSQTDVSLRGTLVARVGSAEKRINLAFANGKVYLECDGLKIKADVKEAIDLVKRFLLPQSDPISTEAQLEIGAVLGTLLSEDFANLFALETTEEGVAVLLQGTQILKAFHVDFALGNVELTLGGGKLGASALGVQVCLQASDDQLGTIDDQAYADTVPYIDALVKMFTADALDANLSFAAGGVSLEGNVNVSLKNRTAQGALVLGYSDGTANIRKTLQFAYVYAQDGGTLYLTVDGLKVKAQAQALLNTVLAVLGKDLSGMQNVSGDGVEILAVVEKVLSFDFGKLLRVQEENDCLNVVLSANELLSAFGVSFDVGEVELAIEKNGLLTVKALGACIALSAGHYEAPVTDGFVDITPLVAAVPEIIEKKSLGFAGSVSLTVEGKQISIELTEGSIGFADGFALYADACVTFGGNRIGVKLNVTGEEIAFIVDGLAARVRFDEFKDIASAVSELYGRVASTINGFIATGEEDGVLADNLEQLMYKLGIADLFAGFAEKFDLSLLNELTIGAPERENGICTLAFGNLKAEILNGGAATYLGVALSYANGNVRVAGNLSLTASDPLHMPEADYLGATEFIELVDYVDAALNTITAKQLSVTFAKGNVTTTETENGVETVKTYDITGVLEYYSGGSYPFIVDLQNKKVTVNVDLYAHAALSVLDLSGKGGDIYLSLDILDYDRNGVLDFFVTLSCFAEGNEKYRPLKLYASADELMDVLASACAMLGVNYDIVNDYLVSQYLNVTTAAQLRALGNSLLKSFGVGDLFSALAGSSAVAENDLAASGNFLKNIAIDNTRFLVEVDGFSLEIGKTSAIDETGAVRSYLTGVGVLVGNTCVDITLDALGTVSVPAVTLDSDYFKLEGIARLVKMLATSATHRADNEIISGEENPAHYELNHFFYVDGSIKANLKVIGIISKEVTVKLVALSISVDEEGKVAANVRLEYDGVNVAGITAINGDTVVDLTLKDGMIYMKRVQSSYFDGSSEKKYPNPVTVYRVMPLANLGADAVNQMAFLLNLGSVITNNLPQNSGDGSETPAVVEKEDFGAMFSKFIGSCVYTPHDDGTCDYVLTVKGSALAEMMGGVTVDDIVVTMTSRFMDDGSEVLYGLGVRTGLTYSVIDLDMDAALIFRNPCQIPVTDKTHDVAAVVATAMEKALNEAQTAGWENILYIEGQTTTVSYVLAGETVAEQNVLFNAKTGECYANLASPDTESFVQPGYDIVWDFSGILHESDGKYFIAANQIVYGSYRPKTYRLTLTDGADWTAEFDYVFGTDLLAEINKAFATKEFSAVSCSLTSEAILQGEREALLVWETHNYAATYYDGAGNVFATQYYKADSPLAYPEAVPQRVGHKLDGWQNAAGERVENGSAVTDDLALYPVWVVDDSAEITVRLYSDLRFANAAFDPDCDGYYTEVTFDETSGYALTDLQVEGYQQMGWWYREENGAWSRLTSVEGKNGASLWAVWIKNIKIRVTNFKDVATFFTIEGSVEGGTVYGKKSKEIYSEVGMTEKTFGTYSIFSKKGNKSDDLKYGAEIKINYGSDGIGTFSDANMTSGKAVGWKIAYGGVGYGGIKITKTFSYGDGLTVSTENASYVSMDTYTVNFADENGNIIKSVGGVRLDRPDDGYDSNVYIDELALREGIAVPEKDGFAGSWEHVAVTGNITVKPVYTAK